MREDVLEIAQYIITKCYVDKKPISNLQLQKILYFIQYSFIANFREPLFDERFEAWQFGPVVPRVYQTFRGYGSMPITMRYTVGHWANFDEDTKTFIDVIVNGLREINPWLLVEYTHRKNGAWEKVYNNGMGAFREIPVEMIFEEVDTFTN